MAIQMNIKVDEHFVLKDTNILNIFRMCMKLFRKKTL